MRHPHLIHQVVEDSASRTPAATAFRCEGQGITYAELNERANQLAHALIEAGVKRGDRVGILLHKSLESSVALFGILKAGAAYVPLDIRQPTQNLAFMIQNCAIEFLIAEEPSCATLLTLADQTPLRGVFGPAFLGQAPPFPTVSWEQLQSSQLQEAPRVAGLTDEDLAYIMYTSGSTGLPKGIMHTHRSGLSYAQMAAGVYGLSAGDVLSNHSPLHFDMSTFDYFSGPLVGATTVIIPESTMLFPATVSELIEREGITVWYSVTSALVDLLLRGDLAERNLSSLRWVNFGGEPFPPSHLRDLMARLPGARFSNVYGPAEVNQCTYFHVPPTPNEYDAEYVPIGRVWEIADSLVIKPDGTTAGEGESGELLIASSTRMQGYWNDPERTRQCFLQQKRSEQSNYGKVFFRTGDQVRIGAGGILHFLGRNDRQVKIRGFRVELDGVEAVITRHAAVAEAAVWLMDTETPEIQAAVRLIDQGAESEQDLRAFLRHALPPYAVPRQLVVLPSFPRTGSGKIDRRALSRALSNTPENGDQHGTQPS